MLKIVQQIIAWSRFKPSSVQSPHFPHWPTLPRHDQRKKQRNLGRCWKAKKGPVSWSKGTCRVVYQNMVPNQGHQNLLQHLFKMLPLSISLILQLHAWDLNPGEHPKGFLPTLQFENHRWRGTMGNKPRKTVWGHAVEVWDGG